MVLRAKLNLKSAAFIAADQVTAVGRFLAGLPALHQVGTVHGDIEGQHLGSQGELIDMTQSRSLGAEDKIDDIGGEGLLEQLS